MVLKKHIYFLLRISVILGFLLFSRCSFGRKYVAFKVISIPSGASVEFLVNMPATGEFIDGQFGVTPTNVKIVYFVPAISKKARYGVRVSKQGYKTKDVYFNSSKWYNTPKEAKKSIQNISVILDLTHSE